MDLNDGLWNLELSPEESTDTTYLVPDKFELYSELNQNELSREFVIRKDNIRRYENGIDVEIIEYREGGVLDIIGGELWEASLILCALILQSPDNFLNSFRNIQSTRSKLKFTAYLVDKKDQWFKSIAAAEVRVPIGKSQQSAGYEYLSFKTKDMLSNALLCGGVGSGKTNFLKSVISSM